MTKLADLITVERTFQRSMRLDTDLGDLESLAGYVAQGTSQNALSVMAQHINDSTQRAFTWTGPYGSGKSSLALLLCSLIGDEKHRTVAKRLLKLESNHPIHTAFAARKGWKIFPLVGHQGNLTKDLARALNTSADSRSIVKALIAKGKGEEGVLLIIDELGKYFESADASENTYLLQEIAENINRCDEKIVLIGILHQAIENYASRLPKEVQDEWAKVQGRFVDIPLLASPDEVIELLSHSISAKSRQATAAFMQSAKAVGEAYAQTRSCDVNRITPLLENAWPLNPVTTVLLGPISRQSFAQNERSIYSFLSSREPEGFQDFIAGAPATADYAPYHLWNYLKTNFDLAIQTTSMQHNWLVASDAIDRASSKGTADHVNLAKTIAVIDLFHLGSGIKASKAMLAAAMDKKASDLDYLLDDLRTWKVIIERRHLGAYAVFSGSDFNLDGELKEVMAQQTGLNGKMLLDLVDLPPIVARRHYLEKGTLRWFERVILPESQINAYLATLNKNKDTTGYFILALPDTLEATQSVEQLRRLDAQVRDAVPADKIVSIGYSRQAKDIYSLAKELQALATVAQNPVLEGDETGRRELKGLESRIRSALIDSLNDGFTDAHWYCNDAMASVHSQKELTSLASDICDKTFNEAPTIQNELINRDHLSTNISGARKELMHRMFNNVNEPELGFTEFPPAYAMYLLMLRGMHKHGNNGSYFETSNEDKNYGLLWKRTKALLADGERCKLTDIYDLWREKPFGLKHGVMPILAFAFFLSNLDALALYVEGVFTPTLDDTHIDDWLSSPKRFEIRMVGQDENSSRLVNALADALAPVVDEPIENNPLSAARAIVKLVLEAPNWSQRTRTTTQETIALVMAAHKAADPISFLFKDLPLIFETEDPKQIAQKTRDCIEDLLAARPRMFNKVREHLFKALDSNPLHLEDLNQRAKEIQGHCGNLRLRAFVSRIMTFTNSDEDIESMLALTCFKNRLAWTDPDIDTALTNIADLGFQFRNQENFATLRGAKGNRILYGIVTGAPNDEPVQHKVELGSENMPIVKAKAQQIEKLFADMPRDLALATLAKLSLDLSKEQD